MVDVIKNLWYRNALVCSHDHLTLFLTLVSGLEFIRFDLELVSITPCSIKTKCWPEHHWHSCPNFIQDVPYLDVAPYMPEYYKPQNLLDFEERLPSSDSISLHSFTSLNSTNLEWDDSAIAPSSEGTDLTITPFYVQLFPLYLTSVDWFRQFHHLSSIWN